MEEVLFIGNNKGTILICHHGGKHHFETSTSYCPSWPFLHILSPVNKLSILTAVEMWATKKKKKSLGILIILGTFACKHLPVCAIWLLAAEKLFFSNVLMNPGTSLPLVWVVCLSPEQGEGWERGVTLADAGELALTFPSLQGRTWAGGFPWASSTLSLPLCIDNSINKNSSEVRKLAAASSKG